MHNFSFSFAFQLCPLDECAEWSPWSPFSDCTGICGGGGTYTRTRRCLFGIVGEPGCMGATSETRSCNTEVRIALVDFVVVSITKVRINLIK